jgi:hypothetical protein
MDDLSPQHGPGPGQARSSNRAPQGRSEANAANQTRSAGSYWIRPTWRRSTVFSCRSTQLSISRRSHRGTPGRRGRAPGEPAGQTILSSTRPASHRHKQAAPMSAGRLSIEYSERHTTARRRPRTAHAVSSTMVCSMPPDSPFRTRRPRPEGSHNHNPKPLNPLPGRACRCCPASTTTAARRWLIRGLPAALSGSGRDNPRSTISSGTRRARTPLW